MVVSCWKGTGTRGHIWAKTQKEMMLGGHTHTHKLKMLHSLLVSFHAAPDGTALSKSSSRLSCWWTLTATALHIWRLNTVIIFSSWLLPRAISTSKSGICSNQFSGAGVKIFKRAKNFQGPLISSTAVMITKRVHPVAVTVQHLSF